MGMLEMVEMEMEGKRGIGREGEGEGEEREKEKEPALSSKTKVGAQSIYQGLLRCAQGLLTYILSSQNDTLK